MTQIILKSTHWAIFLGIVLLTFLAEYLTDITASLLLYDFQTDEYRAIRTTLTTLILLPYPLFAGFELDDRLAKCEKFERVPRWRPIAFVMIFLTTSFLAIITTERGSLAFFGLGAINIVSFLGVFSFPARRLKSIELRRNAGIWEYTPETFQFLVWPLGVWWLQPRLNKIAAKETIIIEE